MQNNLYLQYVRKKWRHSVAYISLHSEQYADKQKSDFFGVYFGQPRFSPTLFKRHSCVKFKKRIGKSSPLIRYLYDAQVAATLT